MNPAAYYTVQAENYWQQTATKHKKDVNHWVVSKLNCSNDKHTLFSAFSTHGTSTCLLLLSDSTATPTATV